MLIEAHSHILACIDDGSNSVETSKRMIAEMRKQGVTKIYATPHFYAHREKSLERYLEKRQAAWEQLGDKSILLGAEVAIEHGISEIEGIKNLAYQNTDLILLEFPYRKYENWMENEIFSIAQENDLTPVIAHIHRYLEFFTKEQMEHILEFPAIFQINNEAFAEHKQAKFVKRLIKDGFPTIFGSDSHNMTTRKPNWDMLQKKCKPDIISDAMETFEKHLLG